MYKNQKKIPTLFGLLILFTGLAAAFYFDRFSKNISTSAQNSPDPQNIHFSNISDNSFTISWLTDSPALGTIEVTGDNKKAVLLDDLDNDNIARTRTTHYFSVKNLNEKTAYNVKIISGQNCQKTNCLSKTQKTLSKKDSAITLPPAHGSIISPNNTGAAGALIYIVIGNTLPLSSYTDSSGLWVIPLNNLRVEDELDKVNLSDNDLVQITAETSPALNSSAVIDLKSIRQNQTIPPMQFGNSYNFIDLLSKKNLMAKSNNQGILGIDTYKPSGKPVDILFPLNSGDPTSDTKPRFRGIGPKGKDILITVNSSPQTGKVTVSSDGTWTWRPPKNLPPGNHTITIGYNDNGNLITETKSFIVLKSGEGFILGIESTPSATLIPTLTLTTNASPTSPSATVSGTIAPTRIPTVTLIPALTAIPTRIPTVTPIPTAVPPAPPRTGNSLPAVILISAATALLGLGAKIIFFP